VVVAAAAAVAIATDGTAADGVSKPDSTTWPSGQDFPISPRSSDRSLHFG